jgi:dienelactone hydrolase
MADHVLAFLNALELSQIVLYGFSIGGYIAQQYPDPGHGHLFQHADEHTQHVEIFLNE